MDYQPEVQPITNTNLRTPTPKKWDRFKDIPRKSTPASMAEQKFLNFMEKLAKVITCVITFAMVLGCAAVSKGTLLFMTSQIADDVTRPVCEGPSGPHNQYEVSLEPRQKIAWMWMITFTFFVPEVATFLRSLAITVFKSPKWPGMMKFSSVLVTESLHTIGLALLVFQILPSLDVVKGAMLTNAVCLVPGIVGLVSRYKGNDIGNKPKANGFLKIVLDVTSVAFQATALVIWPVLYSDRIDDWSNVYLIPISVLLISFGWWENYTSDDSAFFIVRTIATSVKEFKEKHHVIYLFISIWKCTLFFSCMFISPPDGVERSAMFDDFERAFADHQLNAMTSGVYQDHERFVDVHGLTPIWVFLINIGASYLCYGFAKFACKLYIHRFSYAFPANLAMPITVTVLMVMGVEYIRNPCTYYGHIPVHLFYNVPKTEYFEDLLSEDHVWVWFLWVLSQTWITVHIWMPSNVKLASTEQLFVRPLYNPFLIDQDIALNRRRDDSSVKGNNQSNRQDAVNDDDKVTMIYACGTMWHESREEMMGFLKSIMRLDDDQCVTSVVKKKYNQNTGGKFWKKYNVRDYYELETHIFFDDAFTPDPHPQINKYVKDFIHAVDEAVVEVHKNENMIPPPNKFVTPYGGKLVWTLPGKTQLITHLKDKRKIRAKKRWSQVMYMYYLLGHKIEELDVSNERKDLRAKNTYILALDGDIDFQPKAVHLLVDLMKKNENLGAACGRIHPIGFGPMVWYQKFEYSIGHWLQKATEHEIGCVLCSPGCFSLFRGRALIENNVMKRYASKSTKAKHYLQYDQGEDRWLCTLLLQRGFRVEYTAASDSYTHCPETLSVFYKQRRRWITSTVANIFDLLSSYKHTVTVNNNISSLYIMYHAVLMIGTVLGPGMIFLMLVGAFAAVFQLSLWASFFLNLIPILFFVLVCVYFQEEIQLSVAGILSAIYALVMMAVLIGLLLQIISDGILAPASLFIFCIPGQIILTALLHPKEFDRLLCGPIYYIAIPSMFIFLIIYSVFNINNETWGTREGADATAKTSSTGQTAPTASPFDEENKKKTYRGGTKDFFCSVTSSFDCTFCSCKAETQPQQTNNAPELQPITNQMPRLDESAPTTLLTSEATPNTSQATISECTWLNDPILQKSKEERMNPSEETFFRELIDTYLNVNVKDDNEDKARVQENLKTLRDRVILAFFMFNAIFIVILFLLSLSKDQIFIKWPLGVRINFTYVDHAEEVVIFKEYLQLEPIGIAFVVGFAGLLILQFLAMLKHRFQTFCQIMANTFVSFSCFNSSSGKKDLLTEMQDSERTGMGDNDDNVDDQINLSPERRPTVFLQNTSRPRSDQSFIDLQDFYRRRLGKIMRNDHIQRASAPEMMNIESVTHGEASA